MAGGRRDTTPCILDVAEWSASQHGRSTPGETPFGILLRSSLSLRRRCSSNARLANSLPLSGISLDTFSGITSELRARGSLVVMALRYKPAGRGFDSRWCHWNFSVT